MRFEPASALVADNAGLADLAHIIQSAPAYLQQGGWLVLEHGWQQATDVQALLRQAGYQQVATIKDYGDNDRVSLGQWFPSQG